LEVVIELITHSCFVRKGSRGYNRGCPCITWSMGNFPSSKEMVYLSFGFVFILTTFTFGNFLFYSLK
jgi:hypothetical protein